jgi:hypothetical protein
MREFQFFESIIEKNNLLTENLCLESVQIHVVRVVLLPFGRVVQVGFSNPYRAHHRTSGLTPDKWVLPGTVASNK